MRCFVMVVNLIEDGKQLVMLRLHTDEYERAVAAGFEVSKEFYDYLVRAGLVRDLHLKYIYDLSEEAAIGCFKEFVGNAECLSKRKVLEKYKGVL